MQCTRQLVHLCIIRDCSSGIVGVYVVLVDVVLSVICMKWPVFMKVLTRGFCFWYVQLGEHYFFFGTGKISKFMPPILIEESSSWNDFMFDAANSQHCVKWMGEALWYWEHSVGNLSCNKEVSRVHSYMYTQKQKICICMQQSYVCTRLSTNECVFNFKKINVRK
jgi:hypothetical protein